MEKRTQQILLTDLATQRITDCLGQYFNIVRDKVRQIHVLAAIPNLFDRVEVRSIRRQPFHIHATESQTQLPRGRTMHHPTVDNHDDSFAKMSQNLRNKFLEVVRMHICILYRKVKAQLVSSRRNTYRRDSRQSVATVPTVMDGGLAFWCPCPTYRRLKHKPAFVGKYDGFTASSGFFLYAANPSFARGLWLFHRVLWPVVRASDNSSPCPSGYARHWTTRSEYRSESRLLRRLFAASTTRWDSHVEKHLSAAALPVDSSASVINLGYAPAGYEPQMPVRRTSHRLFAIQLPLMDWLRLAWRFLEPCVLVPAGLWLFAAAAPIVWLFQRVSYP